ncbi:MAG: TrbI/VirB10 family protein [Alphaproteobacteria bacterium]|nr:TrbI/VirB10 family protein [Rhodospirillales bacterium]MCW9045308.1 TrbI/VirB10 family protein [Alphaproteobacteria bacterium]
MSTAFCDLALALGLTIGGVCFEPPPSKPPALPGDDMGAWSMPVPPPKEAPAPPPPMPPVVIHKTTYIERPEPVPLQTPAPAPKPKPDLVRLALEANWSQQEPLAGDWDEAIVNQAVLTTEEKPSNVVAPPLSPLGLSTGKDLSDEYEGDRRTSTRSVDNERIVAADRYITGILETGINSQVGGDESGTLIIQVARDVYGYHGRKVLVPKGSRMICSYAPPKDMGSSRLSLKCTRILMAGHRAEILQLDSLVTNVQGHLGTSGEVDRRFWERYGTAVMLTGISTAVRFAAAIKGTDGTDTTTAAAEKAAEELSTRFGEITASVLEETLSLVPIITIPQGTRVQIRPATDWHIADWQKS